jgi:hypothetical protein
VWKQAHDSAKTNDGENKYNPWIDLFIVHVCLKLDVAKVTKIIFLYE